MIKAPGTGPANGVKPWNPFAQNAPQPAANNGGGKGSNKNTVGNKNSKKNGPAGAEIFPLSPTDTVAFGIQRQNLIYANKIARASLAAQAAQIRAQFRLGRSRSIEAGRAGLGEVQGAMADRGLAGSSINQAELQGVRGQVAGEIQDLWMQKSAGLTGVNLSRLDAEAQLRLGLSQLALQRMAQEQTMSLAAFGSSGANPWGF